jgi:hypothetical protein
MDINPHRKLLRKKLVHRNILQRAEYINVGVMKEWITVQWTPNGKYRKVKPK